MDFTPGMYVLACVASFAVAIAACRALLPRSFWAQVSGRFLAATGVGVALAALVTAL